METTIRITVITIIISRREKPSGPLALFGLGRCMRRSIDAPSMTTPPSSKDECQKPPTRQENPSAKQKAETRGQMLLILAPEFCICDAVRQKPDRPQSL